MERSLTTYGAPFTAILTWGRVERVVDEVGDKGSEPPIVATVLWQRTLHTTSHGNFSLILTLKRLPSGMVAWENR